MQKNSQFCKMIMEMLIVAKYASILWYFMKRKYQKIGCAFFGTKEWWLTFIAFRLSIDAILG